VYQPGVGDLGMAERQVAQTSQPFQVRQPYVSQLERDLKSPTVDTLFRICDALAASAADLVRRIDATRKRKPSR
jgi:transcriptional regulator with XRE-family HTH domain